MNISPELAATHQDLSETALRFLLYMLGDAERSRELLEHRVELPAFASDYPYPPQPWPTFVGTRKLIKIRKATFEVNRLVRSIPERILGNTPSRVSKFYGLGNSGVAELLLEAPNGLDGALTRCDFVDSTDGLKCMDINTSAFLGGWQTHYWAEMCGTNPVISSFLREQGTVPYFLDPLRAALLWIVVDSLSQGVAEAGVLNICLVVSADLPINAQRVDYFNEIYSAVLSERGCGLTGRILFCTYPDQVIARGGLLYCDRTRLHAIIEYVDQWTPAPVFRCVKAGKATLYNSPLAKVLSDKRGLALLSKLEDSNHFDAAERATIRAYVPWSRELARGRVSYQGESVDLVDMLLSRREGFVLKHARSAGGEGVHLGRYTERALWSQLVAKAITAGGWLAQEYCESRPYLYEHDGQGPKLHNLVWGLFAFGDTFGGAFLRMMPRNCGDGIINSACGASEGLMFEV